VASVNNLKTASYGLLECDTMLRFQAAMLKIKVFKYTWPRRQRHYNPSRWQA